MKEIIKRLQELGCDKRPLPKWYVERVKDPIIDVPDYPFYSPQIKSGMMDIPVKNIVGTTHEGYHKGSWLEMLGSLKRYKQTPKEIIEEKIKEDNEPLQYAKYNDDYYIVEGNHRTCLAKFYGIEIIKAKVVEYCISDYDLFEAYKTMEKYGLFLKAPEKFTFVINGKNVDLTKKENLLSFIKFYQSVLLNLWTFIKIKLRILRAKDGRYYYIRNDNELQDLFYEIIMHKYNLI